MADGGEHNTVTLSLISHTNVGKTTLARTLLRLDVGEALDHAHVTDVNEAHTLVETGNGERLLLWDTPGFGDTARLLRRLKKVGNPVVWMLTRIWDRLADRPLWCGQQAVKNVREEADVVLYLVNAAEDPESAGYVMMEMEILAWIAAPVIVLLNQTGGGRRHETEVGDEARWTDHLAETGGVRAVLGLDAFARCWVQEANLMRVIADVLADGKKEVFGRLRRVWREQNLAVFRRSMEIMAGELAESVCDSVEVSEQTVLQKVGVGRGERRRELVSARRDMGRRLAGRTRGVLDGMIALHTLEGATQQGVSEIARDSFAVPESVNESIWSAVGGVATGALMGLAADFQAGGLSLGGGAIAGAVVGGAGSFALAKGYNLARGRDNRVRWTEDHFIQQVQVMVMCYLAVAHFGRGRGAWKDSARHPDAWETCVGAAVKARRRALGRIWSRAGIVAEARPPLEQEISRITREVLKTLYPETDVFSAR